MRELKFRYKWKNVWHYIDLIRDNTRAKFEAWESVNKTTPLEQFTGLKDKNGKEIFDRDILVNKSGRICEIIWNEYRASFDAKPLNNLGTARGYTYNRQWIYCEIIGNIHDNPELLKD